MAGEPKSSEIRSLFVSLGGPPALPGRGRSDFDAAAAERLAQQAFDFRIYAPQIGCRRAFERLPQARLDA